ncbi:hypothetical protein TNCV_3509111 [Trichonephila clavipes]|nr:hypothetical protein TNCV_3509111 [Trichonephila clavipes]
MVKRLYADLKRSQPDTIDAELTGHSNSSVFPENIKKVHKIILADRKLNLYDTEECLKVSKGSVFTILHDHLSIRKLCSKRMPRLLTVNQKQQRINDSQHCLELFQQIK